MAYFNGVLANAISLVFIIFAVGSLGYLVGGIEIKKISLGTAGVLLVALLYGIFANFYPNIVLGDYEIVLYSADLKSKLALVSSLGTAMFVSSVGLIAGDKFFRTFNKKFLAYVVIGFVTIAIGAFVTCGFIIIFEDLSPEMAAGLMSGALTSTPALSAAKEVALEGADQVTAGYGIAYLFGVLGVVLFVQIMPRLLKIDIEKERENFVAAGNVEIPEINKNLRQVDLYGFLPFFLTISLGCLLGAFEIPKIGFSLGNSGGCLLAGLIIGHIRHIGHIDLRVDKHVLRYYRELGLVLFLIGAGIPGGVNFVQYFKISYFFYGIVFTLLPMIISFIIARRVFKLDIFNALGSITGGMTSTPALGSLIASSGTEEVAASYAATYPIALVCIVIAVKVLILIF